jgi:hypothetical protein
VSIELRVYRASSRRGQLKTQNSKLRTQDFILLLSRPGFSGTEPCYASACLVADEDSSRGASQRKKNRAQDGVTGGCVPAEAELSEDVRRTPRDRGQAFALRGLREGFAVSPARVR